MRVIGDSKSAFNQVPENPNWKRTRSYSISQIHTKCQKLQTQLQYIEDLNCESKKYEISDCFFYKFTIYTNTAQL